MTGPWTGTAARVGADPAALEAALAGAAGACFALDRAVSRVRPATAAYHRRCDHLGGVHDHAVQALATELLAAMWALDHWTRGVAAALRAVDRGDVPALRAALRTGLLDLAALRAVGADRRLELPLRSAAWRAAAAVHADALAARAEALRRTALAEPVVDQPLRDRLLAPLLRVVRQHVLAPLGPVVDLVPDGPTSAAERLDADAAGLRALLATPDLAWLDVDGRGDGPDRRATARVVLGDPTRADHLVVLVPGTGSGVAGHGRALEDARALHAAASATAAAAGRGSVATVLDLHEAPPSLADAAGPRHATVAGPALADGLADLVRPGVPVTVVGHSHGAVVAGHAAMADMPADRLVLLGAPGAGGPAGSAADLLPHGRTWAALAPLDPIGLVPLLGPLAVHGPLPSDPVFGARRLALDGRHLDTRPTLHAPEVTGHLRYLEPGSFALANIARIAVGLRPWPAPRQDPPHDPSPQHAGPTAPVRRTADRADPTGPADSADGTPRDGTPRDARAAP